MPAPGQENWSLETSGKGGLILWPLFGATNQLLAALALLTFVVFLKLKKASYQFALVPALIMILMPMLALFHMASKFGLGSLIGGASAAMFVLGVFLMATACKEFFRTDH